MPPNSQVGTFFGFAKIGKNDTKQALPFSLFGYLDGLLDINPYGKFDLLPIFAMLLHISSATVDQRTFSHVQYFDGEQLFAQSICSFACLLGCRDLMAMRAVFASQDMSFSHFLAPPACCPFAAAALCHLLLRFLVGKGTLWRF